MIATTSFDLPPIPLDVLDVASENEIVDYLRPVLSATQEVFPSCRITLHLEQDAEIESEQHIVVGVDVTGWSVDNMFLARNRCSEKFARVCPAEDSFIFQIRLVQKPCP